MFGLHCIRLCLLSLLMVRTIRATSLFIASQIPMIQLPFSLENVMATSAELALQSCQESFKWRQWNCPTTDFQLRRESKSHEIDREDAYIYAISLASVLYMMTKDCASGVISDCGCASLLTSMGIPVSDEPDKALLLFEHHIQTKFSEDIYGEARKHNYNAVTTLLSKSLTNQCICQAMGPTGCIEQICIDVLKPFGEIAQDIRAMYEETVELNVVAINMRVVWENIPLDALVATKESPNYCELDAVPKWNGARGRQCSKPSEDNKNASADEHESCEHICSACGFKTRPQHVIVKSYCNCQFLLTYQLHCEICESEEEQYFCY